MDPDKHILITGGAGFIGSHLADRLLSDGYRVTVVDNLVNGSLDNLADAMQHPNFRFIQGDILVRDQCVEATAGAEVIFHLACLGVRHSIHSPLENHRVNAEGTLNVLEAARENRVAHVFYISTSEIYGRTTAFPITEDSPTLPLTVYGASKLAGEHYANAYYECYGLPTTVLRIFNNYGPRAHYAGDAGEVIPRSIVRILHDEQPVIFGDGSITRDFFYVKDTARALAGLLELRAEIAGMTFNIGTGQELSMRSLLVKLLELMDKQDLGINFLSGRPADVPRLWVNAERFFAATGFRPEYELTSGLRETIAYYTELARQKKLDKDFSIINWERS